MSPQWAPLELWEYENTPKYARVRVCLFLFVLSCTIDSNLVEVIRLVRRGCAKLIWCLKASYRMSNSTGRDHSEARSDVWPLWRQKHLNRNSQLGLSHMFIHLSQIQLWKHPCVFLQREPSTNEICLCVKAAEPGFVVSQACALT